MHRKRKDIKDTEGIKRKTTCRLHVTVVVSFEPYKDMPYVVVTVHVDSATNVKAMYYNRFGGSRGGGISPP